MKKKITSQSSIGRWLNDEAHHKDEPKSLPKQEAKKAPKPSKKPSKKK